IRNTPVTPETTGSLESTTLIMTSSDRGFFALMRNEPVAASTPVAIISHVEPPSREMLMSTRDTPELARQATSCLLLTRHTSPAAGDETEMVGLVVGSVLLGRLNA